MVGWFACKYHMVEKSPVVHPIRHLHNICVCVNIITLCAYHLIYLNVLMRVRCHDTLSFQNARLVTGGIGSCSCCFLLWLQHDDEVRAWLQVVVVAALKDKALFRTRGVLNDLNVVNDMNCDCIKWQCISGKPLGNGLYLSSSEWDGIRYCFWEQCASTQYLE